MRFWACLYGKGSISNDNIIIIIIIIIIIYVFVVDNIRGLDSVGCNETFCSPWNECLGHYDICLVQNEGPTDILEKP